MHTYHQLSTGPTRTGLTQTGRFQPYGMSHTRPNEYWNAEAGLSIMVAPPAQYVHPPTWQPSGGIPETTADAETTQTFTEEDKVPVSDLYCSHIPRVTEWLFGVRRLSGPSAPVAGDHLAPAVYRCRRTPSSYATGRSGERDSRKPQPSMRLWLVSTYCISRNDAPDPIDRNAVAVENISAIR